MRSRSFTFALSVREGWESCVGLILTKVARLVGLPCQSAALLILYAGRRVHVIQGRVGEAVGQRMSWGRGSFPLPVRFFYVRFAGGVGAEVWGGWGVRVVDPKTYWKLGTELNDCPGKKITRAHQDSLGGDDKTRHNLYNRLEITVA